MRYKTRRYIKNSFGIVPELRPNKKKTYVVEDMMVKISGYAGVEKTIYLTKEISIEPETGSGLVGIARGNLGFGNLILSNSSGRHLIEGLKNINSFINAVNDEINQVKNHNSSDHTTENQKSEPNENEFDNSSSDTVFKVNLSEKILFPTIPTVLYKLLSKNKTKYILFEWNVKDGDYVKEGDIICKINVKTIIDKSKWKTANLNPVMRAPIDGKINIEGKEQSRWPNFKNLGVIDDISEVVNLNRQNIWFSFHKSTKYDNYPEIGTERLIANPPFKELIYYLFFMDSDITDEIRKISGNEIHLKGNESDNSPEKQYVYLQALSDYDPIIEKWNSNCTQHGV